MGSKKYSMCLLKNKMSIIIIIIILIIMIIILIMIIKMMIIIIIIRKTNETAVTNIKKYVSHGIFNLTFRMQRHTSSEVTVTKYDKI